MHHPSKNYLIGQKTVVAVAERMVHTFVLVRSNSEQRK